MDTPKYATREQWLVAAVAELDAVVFTPHHYPVPAVKVSCSWPGGGSARKRIGECWPTSYSAAGVNEIFISPRIADPVAALDILTHELVHAVDDCQHGHKGAFIRIGKQVGLQGKPTSMSAGEGLRSVLQDIARSLGTYPHATLDLSARKQQKNRHLKYECPECAAVWRMSSK
jgi:hypothetical protein